MKNLFLGAALCALVVTGCSKQDEVEAVEPEQGEAVNVTINGTRHETPSTRTEYEEGADKLIVKWNKSDKLGVFTKDNGATNNAYFSVSGELLAEGKAANFAGNLNVLDTELETTIYGYYPYNSKAVSQTAIPLNLGSQVQDGITNKASLAHLATKDYLAATPVTKKFIDGTQSLSLAFNPLLTIMSFEIKQAMNVQSIKLEAAGTTHPTPFYTDGTVDITTADKTFPITSSGTAQSYVELNVTNGTIAAGATGMFNMMIFPIATGEMPAYFKATVTTVDGTTYVQIKKAPTAGFVRGKRYIMELGDLASTKWDGTYPAADANAIYSGGNGTQATPFLIASAKDFAQFAANGKISTYSNGKYFRLESDIDLDQKPWTPITYFSGNFDGGQHTISHMNVNSVNKTEKASGLFARLYLAVTLANLHVTGKVDVGTDNPDCPAGGICGMIKGTKATISGCSFDGSVTGGSAGGICGTNMAVTTIIACRNSGEIIATQGGEGYYTGGILGRINLLQTVNIIACYNTGKVKSVALERTGGIVGDGYEVAVVTACYNTCEEPTLYNVGYGVTTTTACYAVKANGDGDTAWKATLFSSSWPSASDDTAWTAASDADGTENKYWKSLGSWNGGTNPEYPKLWWE